MRVEASSRQRAGDVFLQRLYCSQLKLRSVYSVLRTFGPGRKQQ